MEHTTCDICNMVIKKIPQKERASSFFEEEALKYGDLKLSGIGFLSAILGEELIKKGIIDICENCKKGITNSFFKWYEKRMEQVRKLEFTRIYVKERKEK